LSFGFFINNKGVIIYQQAIQDFEQTSRSQILVESCLAWTQGDVAFTNFTRLPLSLTQEIVACFC